MRILSNVTNVQLYVILVLPNVMRELSNVRKKIMVLPNATKIRSEVMLVLPNITMELSNVRKKKDIIECDKSTGICDISTA